MIGRLYLKWLEIEQNKREFVMTYIIIGKIPNTNFCLSWEQLDIQRSGQTFVITTFIRSKIKYHFHKLSYSAQTLRDNKNLIKS